MFELLIFSENHWEGGLALSLGRDEGFPGGSVIKNLPANARDIESMASVYGSGRSLGGGNGNPLPYSCLDNPMDRGA